MLRLFLAARLSEASLQYTLDLEKKLRQKVRGRLRLRWTRPQGRHITLAFLGQVAPAQLAQIKESIAPPALRYAPCQVRFGGLGAFPKNERGRALWLAVVDPSGCLQSLAADLQNGMLSLGVKLEQRSYHPHITLARMHDRGGADLSQIVQFDTGTAHEMCVDHFELLHSELRASGAVYQSLARFNLQKSAHDS